MKYSIALLLTLAVTTAFATPPDPFSKWTPKGWKRIALATGDLNADGMEDAAIVLDQIKRLPKVGRLPPRRMLMLLSTPAGLEKALSRDDLLPSAYQEDALCWLDPLLEPDAVKIAEGTLTLAFHHGTSCGSYDTFTEKFAFRLEGARLQLSAYELFQASRSSGDIEQIKVDYVLGSLRTSYGENLFDESQKANTKVEVLQNTVPLHLDEMSLNCNPEKVADMENWCE
ncbi:hypothetical protein [Limnobacter parvus]|uniref:Uncharacterized protein n=1 Tax=Limnobacter parvus TaxID=2939690 RepID=A0ABT1XGX2_9BURK|nr:hypothetical protein [Limnobacter parvus]MCR2746131.1 hypothetical protein [Limnobacter parvus]